MKKLEGSPSKFSRGVSSLWMGMDLLILNLAIKEAFTFWINGGCREQIESRVLFSSARVALASTLSALNVGKKDEVIVCSFTCDAVTHAVMSSGASIVYVDINSDLTMNEDAILQAINCNTKVVIIQNTFGRLGVPPAFFDRLRSMGVITIEDNCLSNGSAFNKKALGSYGDIGIWSLEVSKAITIGWGGVLLINNSIYNEQIKLFCKAQRPVGAFADIRRIIQLWITLLLQKKRPALGVYIWYLLYGLKIFRKSSNENNILKESKVLMGKYSSLIFDKLEFAFDSMFLKASEIHKSLEASLNENKDLLPVHEQNGEIFITPRFSLYVKKELVEKVILMGRQNKIEISRWFYESPPNYMLEKCRISSNKNALKVADHIINLPAYWTLSAQEIRKLKEFIKFLNENEYLVKL